MPIRSSQKRGHDVADEDQRHKKENAFDSLVTALNNQPPNSGCREGYRHKAGDAQKFSRRGDAHKFRNRHSPVGDQQRQHPEGRPTHAKPFANQIGKAFAGNRSHSRAHFLHDSQTDRYGYECPEDGIAVISPGRSVSGNTTGIISRVSGDNAWANDRKINEPARLFAVWSLGGSSDISVNPPANAGGTDFIPKTSAVAAANLSAEEFRLHHRRSRFRECPLLHQPPARRASCTQKSFGRLRWHRRSHEPPGSQFASRAR